MKEILTTMASMMGVWAFCQSLLQSVFPPELRLASLKFFHRLFNYFSRHCYYDITEIDGVNTNELYNAAQLYLSSSASITGTRLTLTRGLNSSSITFGLSANDRLIDTFRGATVAWEHNVTQRQSQAFSWRPVPEEKRGFTLRARKKHKQLVLTAYLDHVTAAAAALRHKTQDRLLYTNTRGGSVDARGHHPWESVPFKHPSTFETLAMDPARKAEIAADLTDFACGESFYQKTGRAWKRGYLLYGPPGTGKSSMIAAMANYLGYDIYDLELTEVNNNSELRKLLMKTTSKSIIVIEDIDCSIELTNRSKSNPNPNPNPKPNEGWPAFPNEDGPPNSNSITLSGLLNFTDGLWSCCGSERIFVFTTNHVERLDPALLRCGRMDMHVHMSYCSVEALKILLRTYLGLEEDDLEEGMMGEIEKVIEKAEMTPADVSEVLIKNRRDKSKAVDELLEALRVKAETNDSKRKVGNVAAVEDQNEEEKRTLESSCGNTNISKDDDEVDEKMEEI